MSGGLSPDARSTPFSDSTSNSGASTRRTVMLRTCRFESIVVPPSSFSSGPIRMKTWRAWARRARPARPRNRSAGISTSSTMTAGTANATTGTQLGAASSASTIIGQR
jgi:hypothetical protein